MKYGDSHAGRFHRIEGCDFFKDDGKYYGTLIVDFDPDWEKVNSVNYMSTDFSVGGLAMFGINITRPRTNEDPNAAFGRTDNHAVKFLGISSDGDKVDSGLAAAFMPRYKE